MPDIYLALKSVDMCEASFVLTDRQFVCVWVSQEQVLYLKLDYTTFHYFMKDGIEPSNVRNAL